MKAFVSVCLLGVMLLSACTGISVNEHKTDGWGLSQGIDGVTFKTVEVYKTNALGASYSFIIALQCDGNGKNCIRAQDTPHLTPGIVSSLIAPVIQAGAIVGGAALIGQGIRDSKSTTNVSNGSQAVANGGNNLAVSGSSANAAAKSNANASSYSKSGADVNVNTGAANGNGSITQY